MILGFAKKMLWTASLAFFFFSFSSDIAALCDNGKTEMGLVLS